MEFAFQLAKRCGGSLRPGAAIRDRWPRGVQFGQPRGEFAVSADPVVNLGGSGPCTGQLVLGTVETGDRRRPLPRRPAGRGEVALVLGLDAFDQQGLRTREIGGFSGRDVERPGQSVAPGEIHRGGRGRLQYPLGVPQPGVDGLFEHGHHPLVGFVPGELFAARLEDGQLGLALLVEALSVAETVGAGGDLGGHLRADIGVGGLDDLDVLVTRAVLVLQQQVQCLDHRGLTDLIGAADHYHAVVGEVDLAVGDTPIVGQYQSVQLHAALPSTSRSSRPNAA